MTHSPPQISPPSSPLPLPGKQARNLRWVLCLVGLSVGAPALAQQKNQIIFPLNEDLTLKVRQADRYVAAKKYREALELYIKALAEDQDPRDPNKLIELASYGEGVAGAKENVGPERFEAGRFRPRRFQGATLYIQQRLLDLPDEALSLYRERFDYRAKAAFEIAMERRSEGALEGFYSRFLASSFGVRALRCLGDLAFERGDAARAARLYERLEGSHKRDLDSAERRAVKRLRLICSVGLGRLETARTLCKELGLPASRLKVSYGEKALGVKELLAQAVKNRGVKALAASKTLSHVRGNGAHWSAYDRALWVGEPRFLPKSYSAPRRPSSSVPDYSRNPRYLFPSQPRPRPSSTYGGNACLPVVVEAPRRRDGRRVMEPLAMLSTGTSLSTIWLKDGIAGPPIRMPFLSDHTEGEGGDKVLLGGGAGQGIFVASFVEEVRREEHFRGIPITVNIPVRKLLAFDTKSWRWIWNHRDYFRGDEKRRSFRKMSFPSPPVIVGDTVYAAAIKIEGTVQSYVMAFDLQSGELRWSTYLCSGQVEATMFGEQAREPLVSSVAVRDGVVYHTTCLGAVSALDGLTGKPLWTTSYEQVEIEPPKGYYPVPRSLGWANNPPVLRDGVLVTTPLDSDHALAYDARTGERLWRVDRRPFRSRKSMSHIVGADRGRVVFSGRQRVDCFDLKSGRLIWSKEDFVGQRIAGRGLIADGRVCLSIFDAPSNTYPSKILQLDLADGSKVREHRTSGSQGGDLSMFGDTVLIVGSDVLGAYFNREAFKRSRDF